ncbi:uncharacterized protein LOC143448590 [Clavelina lepadiformis]|uniref:uncharacterized protein LOC143448590 n=1 Tax=Clavelina lepadiformis TaxID=159417 RepID=UPI004041E486
MKVIVAGDAKTGTTTMCTALTILGYKTYDFFEHYSYHGDDWNKLLESGGSVDDFRRMYQDVDAVTDVPACYFWEQIHEAFPDAKIILSIRDEDAWYKSFSKQFVTNNGLQNFFTIAPSIPLFDWWKLYKWYKNTMRVVSGIEFPSKKPPNEMVSRLKYRMHNNYVIQMAPKDKLLVYKVSEGWEPLCKFLNAVVPNVPFPRKNVNATFWEETAKENPIAIANRKRNSRLLIKLFGGLALIVALCYKLS